MSGLVADVGGRIGAADGEGRRAAQADAAGSADRAAGVPAERRGRTVHRGLRQRRRDAAQGGHHATVTTDEGKVLFKTEEMRDSSDLAGKRGGYGYTTRIPMKDLALGSYVLKVEAKSRLGERRRRWRASCSSRSSRRGRGRRDDRCWASRSRRCCAVAAGESRRRPCMILEGAGYEDDRQGRSEQHRRREAGAGADGGRVGEAVAAARAESTASGGRFHAERWSSACSSAAVRTPASAWRSSARPPRPAVR